MNVQFSISEHARGRVYKGTLTSNKKQFFWVLVFTVALSNMDKEVKRRQKQGQELTSDKVRNELFTLVILDKEWQEIEMGNKFRENILGFIVSEASNINAAPFSDIWNQISGGSCPSPFGLSQEIEIEDSILPEKFR